MEIALVDGLRRRPIKGQRGICQYCGDEMVAKCGRVVIWHWAHMPRYRCDPWWGSETAWHREWKARFPTEWREVVHIDEPTGEKHIADVKTQHGLVIEFQHSSMDYGELVSREDFYENMIWVVDGDRGSLDPNFFGMGLGRQPMEFRPLVHLVKWWGRGRLLHKWAEATAPVYIDFGWQGLWLFREFQREENVGVFSPLSREWLVEACQNGDPIPVAEVPIGGEADYLSTLELVEVYSLNG